MCFNVIVFEQGYTCTKHEERFQNVWNVNKSTQIYANNNKDNNPEEHARSILFNRDLGNQ